MTAFDDDSFEMTFPYLICVLATAMLLAPESARGFVFKGFQASANPALAELAKSQSGTVLNLRLDVGTKNNDSRMYINGLVLELNQEVPSAKHTSLPGANGPNAGASTGAKSLTIKSEASFIDLNGMQQVPLLHGCWELVWREEAPAGVLVCGFELETDVKRNEAILPAGRLYLSFPVWTKDGLVEQQARKEQVERAADEFQTLKKTELKKMDSTNNPIRKALHFRNAVQATEKLEQVGLGSVKQIPSDNEVAGLQGNLLIATKGFVSTKEDSYFGPDHALLGTAYVSPQLSTSIDACKT